MIDISIIIVNYNVKEYLIPCIKSIFQYSNDYPSFEIILVDNNSTDDSISSVKKEFPNIRLILNTENIGFSKAVNQGYKYSDAKYIFILNPDTYLIDNTINKLFNFMEKNQDIALLGPTLLSTTNKVHQSYWRKTTLINTLLSLLHLEIINNRKNYNKKLFKIPTKVNSISGGAFFVRSSIFKMMKGFNENLFWMEDIDFCLRLSKLGHQIYYFPSAKVVHYIGKSSEINMAIVIYNQLMSKIKYFKIHHSKFETFILTVSILLISLIKSTLLIFTLPFKKSNLKKLFGYLSVSKNIIKNYLFM
jgi:N-acetylglucosaminyl-diphospho-decaprenol L-rhamnosyltransferase